MKQFIATIKEKGLHFEPTTRALFMDYLREHEGDTLEIKPRKIRRTVSRELRGFYWASWLPFIKNLDDHFKKYTIDELHEFLRYEFNGTDMYNPVTKKETRIAKSIMSNQVKTDEAFMYMEKIRRWVAENYGEEMPDAEDFKRRRDMHFADTIEKVEYPQENYDPEF
jgi:hypothetical protein